MKDPMDKRVKEQANQIAGVINAYNFLKVLNPNHNLLYLIKVTGPESFNTDEGWNTKYQDKLNPNKEVDMARQIGQYRQDLEKAIRTTKLNGLSN